jgi:hypothetical protein
LCLAYVSKYLFDWGLFDSYKYKCEVSRLVSIPAKRLIPVPAGIFLSAAVREPGLSHAACCLWHAAPRMLLFIRQIRQEVELRFARMLITTASLLSWPVGLGNSPTGE